MAVGGGTLQGPGGGPPKAMPKLRGVGMLGLHPMVQLAGWGPISLQLGPHRAAQLQRYRYKRMLRMRALATGEKRIRYQCRKQLADARPRVKGRFAKIHGPDGLLAKQREEAAAALVSCCPRVEDGIAEECGQGREAVAWQRSA